MQLFTKPHANVQNATNKIIRQESPANAKGTRDSSACMKAHCEQT